MAATRPNHRSVIRLVAQARSPQESMSENDEDRMKVVCVVLRLKRSSFSGISLNGST